jgi:DNA-binding NtrC family response regulator
VAARQPVFPRVIAISGCADADTAFHLAQTGVRCFISKPLDLGRLQQAWDMALHVPPDLRPFIRACVGQRRLHDLEEQVRRQMTDEALAAGGGSRHKASALLGISRQLLQNILRTRA